MKAALSITLLCVALLSACGPVTLSATLGERDQRLVETSVINEDHASAKVALIEVRGLIVDAATPGVLAQGGNPVDDLVAALDKAAGDGRVRAVVLRIDSPGGSVTASDVMYREVRRFIDRTGKPVIASLSTVAASGGYYLALAADQIVAEPTGITASIGVIFPTFNVSQAMDRFGIASRAVVSRPNKDLASPFEPMEDEHYRILQSLVDESYARFRALVVERRPTLVRERLDEATDGRILSGTQALEMGLVDSTGGLREAFEAAKAAANLQHARLIRYHPPGERPRTPYASATLPPAHAAGDPPSIRLEIPGLDRLRLEPGAYYIWMP